MWAIVDARSYYCMIALDHIFFVGDGKYDFSAWMGGSTASALFTGLGSNRFSYLFVATNMAKDHRC